VAGRRPAPRASDFPGDLERAGKSPHTIRGYRSDLAACRRRYTGPPLVHQRQSAVARGLVPVPTKAAADALCAARQKGGAHGIRHVKLDGR
jgi:hypothetical protein